jgi:hypothetical protein
VWLLAAASVAALWPAIGKGDWRSVPPVPPLFTTSAYRSVIHRGENVFAPPVGGGSYSDLWQADTGLWFNLIGGYVLPEAAPNSFKKWGIYPALIGAPVPLNADVLAGAREFLAAQHAQLAVIGDADVAAGSQWPAILQKLGWSGGELDGALVLRPPA